MHTVPEWDPRRCGANNIYTDQQRCVRHWHAEALAGDVSRYACMPALLHENNSYGAIQKRDETPCARVDRVRSGEARRKPQLACAEPPGGARLKPLNCARVDVAAPHQWGGRTYGKEKLRFHSKPD